jgi:hypothetical protein
VLLTVWCEECGHQIGPTAGVAARWDDETPVPDRRERLAFPRCGSRRADNRGDRYRSEATRVVTRLIVVGGLVLALSACSATRAIDIICPHRPMPKHPLRARWRLLIWPRSRVRPEGRHKCYAPWRGRRVVDDIWRLIWPGYRDRSRWILVRRGSGRVGSRLRRSARRSRRTWLLSEGFQDCTQSTNPSLTSS